MALKVGQQVRLRPDAPVIQIIDHETKSTITIDHETKMTIARITPTCTVVMIRREQDGTYWVKSEYLVSVEPSPT